MAPTFSGAAAAALYLIGAFWHWRRLQHLHTATPSNASSMGQASNLAGPLLALGSLAVVFHGLSTASLLQNPAGVDFGIGGMAVGVAWVIALFTLLASLRLPVSNLLLLIFPLCAVALLLALVSGLFQPNAANQGNPVQLSPALLSHILISVSAYSILTMAALQSVLLGFQEHRLRNRQVQGIGRFLPPMETMERLLFALLSVGLIMLTIAIASGFAFLDNMFAQNISHHTILACLAWVVFAVLLYGHKVLGWRGYTAVRWTLLGFGLLLLGYFGSKFVSEILLRG